VAGIPMRLCAYPIGDPRDFNGLQTAMTYAYRESPFVIFVGSFGKAKRGGFSPSAFSDIGTSADGLLIPHVLGPGELTLDGRELTGTSFASPFITALHATRVGYNFKNVIERSASKASLAAGVGAHESSRWGIPEADKVISRLQEITGPTKIEGVSHRIEGDNLVVDFSVSRCCMQSLMWSVDVALIDGAAGTSLLDDQQQPIKATANLRTESSDYVTHAARVSVPLPRLAAAKGRQIALAFSLNVRAWKAPPAGSLEVDSAPDYRFTLQ
jgi:hypothetical protein